MEDWNTLPKLSDIVPVHNATGNSNSRGKERDKEDHTQTRCMRDYYATMYQSQDQLSLIY